MQPIKLLLSILPLLLWASCSPGHDANRTTKLSAGQEELLDRVQLATFNYYWEGAETVSGAARERIHMDDIYPSDDRDVVTTGGTGFGVLAVLAGVNRGFISRKQAYQRLLKLTNWLEKADRFHGAWPHWLFPDGKTKPFSRYDDGGDLVETAFLAQGLLAARQFFRDGNDAEKALAARMDTLWREIEWDWYTQGKDVLYWHWSPNYGWKMDFDVEGYNECLIMYVLAASSPTHPVPPACYHKGFARDGKMYEGQERYGIPTIVNHYAGNDMDVGPLFWAHYSYLGLDPRGLSDGTVSLWEANVNHARIHHAHGRINPYGYKGYSAECWGLTSSYSMLGYSGHNPQEDLGVISPTAALSSFPYTPEASMQFLEHLYRDHEDLIGTYGPYDAFSEQSNWYLPRYLAIDQLPIPVMIENYRSGFIWDLFMSAPEVQEGLKKLNFQKEDSN